VSRARAWMSWSSGKDSTFALHMARQDPGLDVVGLLTTINEDADRVAMHAVRRQLLEAQADRVGLPLHPVPIPSPCPNEVYEARMADAVAAARDDGVDRVVFGDLFLADVRAYREQMLEGTGVAPAFPLWHRPTGQLAQEMIAAGVRAVLVGESLMRSGDVKAKVKRLCGYTQIPELDLFMWSACPRSVSALHRDSRP
jgi:diphthamide synthase (EF-2-diphthine--ammonia ligase)